MTDLRFWLVLTFSALATLLPARELLELGGITVNGCEYTDPQSVKELTGLQGAPCHTYGRFNFILGFEPE